MHKTLLVAIALPLLLAGPAQAVLQPDPSRFDLDNQLPGAVIERSLSIRNHADTTAEFGLQVVRFHDEDVTVSPSRLVLGPGDVGTVRVTIRLADDAAGGRHDLRITATGGESQSTDGVGARSAVRLPVIFHVENLKVASLRVQDAMPDVPGDATVMVFNHLPHETEATLHVLVRDQVGKEVFRARSGAEAIPPEEHRFVTVPIGELPGGAYTVKAWAEHAGGRSNPMEEGYAVGVKAMDVSPARVEPLGGGLYRLSAELANTGTIGLDVQARFRIEGPVSSQDIAAHSYSLDASEQVTGSTTVRLEPGLHEIVAVATWDAGEASSPATTYTASDKDQPVGDGGTRELWGYGMIGLGIGAGVAVALRRRRGAG